MAERADPMQVWDFFAHGSNAMAGIFDKDGLYLSNPNTVNLI
jgi:hypothetical protein